MKSIPFLSAVILLAGTFGNLACASSWREPARNDDDVVTVNELGERLDEFTSHLGSPDRIDRHSRFQARVWFEDHRVEARPFLMQVIHESPAEGNASRPPSVRRAELATLILASFAYIDDPAVDRAVVEGATKFGTRYMIESTQAFPVTIHIEEFLKRLDSVIEMISRDRNFEKLRAELEEVRAYYEDLRVRRPR